jgi:mono/diheme cytochrome c family protein
MKCALVASMLVILASQQASAQDESSKRAYLGVQLQAGALVESVAGNGPAQAAGIERGDMIISFDGKKIRSADELSRIVAETPIGKEVVVGLIRRGKEETTTARLGQRPIATSQAAEIGEPAKGVAIANNVCSRCHAIRTGQLLSPDPMAPTFVRIATTPGITGMALNVMLLTPHAGMPMFKLGTEQREDLIAYILSLKD